jgi:hypothetical protein
MGLILGIVIGALLVVVLIVFGVCSLIIRVIFLAIGSKNLPLNRGTICDVKLTAVCSLSCIL